MASEQLLVKLTLADKFSSGLRKAGTSVRGFAKSAGRNFLSLGKTIGRTTALFTGLGTAVSAVGFGFLLSRTAEADDQLGKLSQRLGLSTEFLSEFGFAASQAGIDSRTLNLSLQRVQRRFGEIQRTGKGTALPALRDLGLVEEVRSGADFADVLGTLANRLAGVDSEAKRLSISFQLFDSEGAKLVQLLGGGSQAVEDLMKRARALGLSISGETTDRAATFVDAMSELRSTSTLLGEEISRVLVPSVTELASTLTDLVIDNKERLTEFFRNTFGGVGRTAQQMTFYTQVVDEMIAKQGKLKTAFQFSQKHLDPLAGFFPGTTDFDKVFTETALEMHRAGETFSGALVGETRKIFSEFDKAIDSEMSRVRERIEKRGVPIAKSAFRFFDAEVSGVVEQIEKKFQKLKFETPRLRPEQFRAQLRKISKEMEDSFLSQDIQPVVDAVGTNIGQIAGRFASSAEKAVRTGLRKLDRGLRVTASKAETFSAALKDGVDELIATSPAAIKAALAVEEYKKRLAEAETEQRRLNNGILGLQTGLTDLRVRFSSFNQMRSLVNQLGTELRDNVVDEIDKAVDGTFRLRDALLNLLTDIRRALTRALISKLVSSALASEPSVGGGGGGGVKVVANETSNRSTAPQRGTASSGDSGLGVEGTFSSSSSVPDTLGNPQTAEEFHRGGVTGNREQLARLSPNEAVIPLEDGDVPVSFRGRRSSGSVTINNVTISAVDAASVDRLVQNSVAANPEFIANIVSSEQSRRPHLQ